MMIGKRPAPVTGILSRSWGYGSSSGSATSPRSPLEIKSPKGPKKYYFVNGVGLGIIVALEKSDIKTNKPIFTRSQSRSNEEDYTFVTCHEPSRSCTRVYYDDGVTSKINNFATKNVKKHDRVLFEISPTRSSDDFSDFRGSDFLSYCHLCRKKLHGKDIYMYKGEKTFCSTECRYAEIVKDERKEKQQCTSKLVASRSHRTTDRVSPNLPCVTKRCIFATGTLAA